MNKKYEFDQKDLPKLKQNSPGKSSKSLKSSISNNQENDKVKENKNSPNIHKKYEEEKELTTEHIKLDEILER